MQKKIGQGGTGKRKKKLIQLNFLHIMLSFIHWSPLCLKAALEYQLL